MSRTWRWVVGLAVVLLMANVVVALVQSRGAAEGTPDFSTYRAGRRGTKALYNTFARLGMQVSRHEAPLSNLPEACTQLWLLHPTEPIAYDELDALQQWVHDGGQLIVGYAGFLSYASAYTTWLNDPAGSPFPELLAARPPVDLSVSGVAGAVLPARGAHAFPLTREGIFRRVHILYAPTDGVIEYDVGVVPVARSVTGTVVAGQVFGEGAILWIGDLDMLSNAGCSEADNIVLLSNIAGLARGLVCFDEFHHGFAAGPTGPVGLIQSSRARGVVGVVVLGMVILIIAVGSRFGRPEEASVPPRRSQLEYVDSVAQMYRNAAARQVAILSLYQATMRRLAGATRLVGDADHAQLARMWSMRVGVPAEEIEEALNEAKTLADRGCDDDVTLLRVASRLARICPRQTTGLSRGKGSG